jgi:hypothetical protein
MTGVRVATTAGRIVAITDRIVAKTGVQAIIYHRQHSLSLDLFGYRN